METPSSSHHLDSRNASMPDFAAARRMMVDGQVRTSDVTDQRIIGAMLALPRERFVPETTVALAYLDLDPPAVRATAGEEVRRLLKPMVLAKMVQAAAIKDTDHVLDVGCATGYSAALLGRLAGSVVALEEDRALARFAEDALKSVGAGNISVVTGSLVDGCKAKAPYDVIFVEGAIEVVPHALCEQLKDGGRLVAVVGRAPTCRATLYRSVRGDVSGWPIFDASAPALPGFAKPPAFVF
jgi:protein-L-isoaspartate(D-aspartate) O-methyltransferase